jgi:hypothetical protein
MKNSIVRFHKEKLIRFYDYQQKIKIKACCCYYYKTNWKIEVRNDLRVHLFEFQNVKN